MFNLTPYERKNYDLFNLFRDFDKEFFDSFPTTSHFSTDIRDDGNSYSLEAEMPGFSKSDIDISVNGDYLTISAEHKNSNDEKDKSGEYIRRERSFSSYRRSFGISNINADDIKAEYNDGILKLTLPKKQPDAPAQRRIEIG